jgi:hypothetical protein
MLISKPPVLASSEPGEILLLYVMATQVISAALVVEREEPGHVYKVQRPVYYISKVLFDCETRYNQVQKLFYAVLMVTSFGLREVVRNRLAKGRIAKWALELMGLDKTYVPQTAIKSHALTNFVAEWIETQQPPPPPDHSRALQHVFRWLLHPQWCRGRHSVDLS